MTETLRSASLTSTQLSSDAITIIDRTSALRWSPFDKDPAIQLVDSATTAKGPSHTELKTAVEGPDTTTPVLFTYGVSRFVRGNKSFLFGTDNYKFKYVVHYGTVLTVGMIREGDTYDPVNGVNGTWTTHAFIVSGNTEIVFEIFNTDGGRLPYYTVSYLGKTITAVDYADSYTGKVFYPFMDASGYSPFLYERAGRTTPATIDAACSVELSEVRSTTLGYVGTTYTIDASTSAGNPYPGDIELRTGGGLIKTDSLLTLSNVVLADLTQPPLSAAPIGSLVYVADTGRVYVSSVGIFGEPLWYAINSDGLLP